MKNCLIIGSVAARHWFADFNRVPLDIDLLSPQKTGNPILCEPLPTGKYCIDVQWHDAGEFLIDINHDSVFLDPELLLTLKVSHAHWDVKWKKTMYDIHFLRNIKKLQINHEAYDRLFAVWSVIHGEKKVHMNKSMDEFFDDNVKRKYDHDKLHELIAFGRRPMHELIRTNEKTVLCSEELFSALSYEMQLRTALEEILVVAIERSNLSRESSWSVVRSAVSNAHFRLVTSMTTGWFARFLILNHYQLLIQGKELWEPHLKKFLTSH